jgi:hypothetical protein
MCEFPGGAGPSFDSILGDPMIRLVMASDGVSVADMREILQAARLALCARDVSDEPASAVTPAYAE